MPINNVPSASSAGIPLAKFPLAGNRSSTALLIASRQLASAQFASAQLASGRLGSKLGSKLGSTLGDPTVIDPTVIDSKRIGSGRRNVRSAPCSPSACHRANLSEQDMQLVRDEAPSLRPGFVRAKPTRQPKDDTSTDSRAAAAGLAGRAPVRKPRNGSAQDCEGGDVLAESSDSLGRFAAAEQAPAPAPSQALDSLFLVISGSPTSKTGAPKIDASPQGGCDE